MEFQVTLAHKRNKERLNVEEGVFIQPKLDGVRCYTQLVDGEVKMFSRNHKEILNARHLTTSLRTFFESHPNVVLDGELYNHNLRNDFERIISIVRKQKPSQADRFESASILQYHVYDMYDYDNWYYRYEARLRNIKQFKFDHMWRMISIVDTFEVNTQQMVDDYEQHFLDKGYEGAMLRANIPYEQKRSHGLQKVKRFLDDEAQVIEVVEGKGKLIGAVGKFMMKHADGRVFGAPAGKFTHEERRKMWNNRNKYLNTIWTYEYFELTKAGMPRFPLLKCERNYE